MPIDFSPIDESVQRYRKQIQHVLSIAQEIKDLDWRGKVSARIDSIAIHTNSYEDHRHNVRVALDHYGGTIARCGIYHQPYPLHFPGLTGQEVWTMNGKWDSPIELVYHFNGQNPPDRLTNDGHCSFVEGSVRQTWACKV